MQVGKQEVFASEVLKMDEVTNHHVMISLHCNTIWLLSISWFLPGKSPYEEVILLLNQSLQKTQQKWPRIVKLPCAIPMEWQSLAFVEEIVEWYTGKKLQGSQLWPFLATNFNHPLIENANKSTFGGTSSNPQTSVFSLKTSKEFLKCYFVVISNCISLCPE